MNRQYPDYSNLIYSPPVEGRDNFYIELGIPRGFYMMAIMLYYGNEIAMVMN